LLRCQERGGWVDEAQHAAPDPHDVERALEGLAFHSNTVADAFWHHVVEVDGAELRRTRMKQKLQLSRYGRQPFLAREWEDVDVVELGEWYRALGELLREEDETSRQMEDR